MDESQEPVREGPDAGKVSVAAVVLTYERQHLLARCLEGLCSQTRPPDEIFVVDNGSRDGTDSFVRTRYPGVRLVRIDQNVGSSGGFAAGIRHACEAGYDWVWTFDDDDRPDTRALGRLLDQLATLGDPGAAGMIGSWATVDGTVVPEGEMWRGGNRVKVTGRGPGPYPVDLLTFSGTLISSALVRAIGLPRADLFLSFEDVEFCLRTARSDFKIYVVPEPLTSMLRAGSPAKGTPPLRAYYQARNHLALALERRSPSEVFWWMVRQAKLSAATILWLDHKRERLLFRARGALDGLRGSLGKGRPWGGRTPAGALATSAPGAQAADGGGHT